MRLSAAATIEKAKQTELTVKRTELDANGRLPLPESQHLPARTLHPDAPVLSGRMVPDDVAVGEEPEGSIDSSLYRIWLCARECVLSVAP